MGDSDSTDTSRSACKTPRIDFAHDQIGCKHQHKSYQRLIEAAAVERAFHFLEEERGTPILPRMLNSWVRAALEQSV